MTKQQLTKYLETISFGLKDYERTYAKYSTYKQAKYNDLGLHIDPSDLVDNAISSIYSKNNWVYQLTKELDSKSNIRQMKTVINSYTYEAIKNYINRYCDDSLNDNELKSFATKVYIDNYNEFNEAMLEQLKYMVLGEQ